jgi:filamentous hemagglutinin family protein
MHTLANEREDSIQLDWKKETGSSFWEAEVNSFDVPSGAVVEVKGPKDGLIRVTGDQPTSIYGTITSSNPVYVINPNGVVVGPGASINDDTFSLIRIKNAQENLKQTKPLLWELESNARAGDADAQYNLGKYYASRNLHKFGYSGWTNPEKQE